MIDRNNYDAWKKCNYVELRGEYDEYMEKEYTPIMPDTYASFDDFCMGKWQCR